MGQGGTESGIDPRLYTAADLTRIIPLIDATHATCNGTEHCASNTAAYLISLSPKLTNGENKYNTLGVAPGSTCIACHGEEGTGESLICSYAQDGCDSVKDYDAIKVKVERMNKNGDTNGTPKFCTETIGGAKCSEDVSLYLKALGWKREK